MTFNVLAFVVDLILIEMNKLLIRHIANNLRFAVNATYRFLRHKAKDFISCILKLLLHFRKNKLMSQTI